MSIVTRIPFYLRPLRNCEHAWSEPNIERLAYRRQPAIASWTCLKCGKREQFRDAA